MIDARQPPRPSGTRFPDFDTAALTATAPRRLGQFRRDLRRTVPGATRARTALVVAAWIVVIVTVAVIALSVLLVAGHQSAAGAVLIPAAVVLAAIAVALWWLTGRVAGSARTYRLHRFAEANGMTYSTTEKDPDLPGVLFGRGIMRTAHDVFRDDESGFEVGGFTYRVRSWMDSRTTAYRRGYVGIRLPRHLPNIVLMRRGSWVIRDLWDTFDRNQRMSLEGDWDKSFTLYCPRGYERDALYLFAPDVMAEFIDSAGRFDAEIIDDWLFLYAPRPLRSAQPATWVDLHRVMVALENRISGWSRWSDERSSSRIGQPRGAEAGIRRLSANEDIEQVAPEGRRLRSGLTWLGVVAAVAVVAYGLLALVR